MNTKQINDIEIRPIKITKTKGEVYCSDMLPNPYGTIALIAKTNSGKTNCLYNILEHTVDSKMKSNCVIFCSTIDLDDTYKKIIELLELKKCNVMTHTHFIENGENLIEGYLDIIQNPPESDEEERNVIRTLLPNGCVLETIKPKRKKKKKEPEKISAKWIFIFDDLGKDTRHTAMNYIQKSRHYKIRNFILTQHLSNISPVVRKQISTCLFFRSFSRDKLQMIYEDLDIEIPFRVFEELYKYATRDAYAFLTYDVYLQRFRKNFSILLEPKSEDE